MYGTILANGVACKLSIFDDHVTSGSHSQENIRKPILGDRFAHSGDPMLSAALLFVR